MLLNQITKPNQEMMGQKKRYKKILRNLDMNFLFLFYGISTTRGHLMPVDMN